MSDLFRAIDDLDIQPDEFWAGIDWLTRLGAPGLRTLTTQVNIPGDTYIDDDIAFATRDGLIVELEPDTAPAG